MAVPPEPRRRGDGTVPAPPRRRAQATEPRHPPRRRPGPAGPAPGHRAGAGSRHRGAAAGCGPWPAGAAAGPATRAGRGPQRRRLRRPSPGSPGRCPPAEFLSTNEQPVRGLAAELLAVDRQAGKRQRPGPPQRAPPRPGAPADPGRAGRGCDDGPPAIGARPARTPLESRCPAGCRETAGTAGAASRSPSRPPQQSQRLADQVQPPGQPQPPRPRPGAGPGPAPPRAAAAPGCGCAASDPAGWWHSRGAAPDKARPARPATGVPRVSAARDRRAGCRAAGVWQPVAAATTPAAPAARRWVHRRDHRPPAARGPRRSRWPAASPGGRSRSPADHHRCRSAPSSGPAPRCRSDCASGTADGGKGWWRSRPACGCRTNSPRWRPPRPAGRRRNRSCRATRPGCGTTPGRPAGCSAAPPETGAAARRYRSARSRSRPRDHSAAPSGQPASPHGCGRTGPAAVAPARRREPGSNGRNGAGGSAPSAPGWRRRCAQPPARCRPPARARRDRDGHDRAPARIHWRLPRGSRVAVAAPPGPPGWGPADRRDQPDRAVRVPAGCGSGRRRRGRDCASATPVPGARLPTSARAGASDRRYRTDHRHERAARQPATPSHPPTSADRGAPPPARARGFARPDHRPDASAAAATGRPAAR